MLSFSKWRPVVHSLPGIQYVNLFHYLFSPERKSLRQCLLDVSDLINFLPGNIVMYYVFTVNLYCICRELFVFIVPAACLVHNVVSPN